jgi:hypothetical protein
MHPLFAHDRAAINAGLFLDGLLGDERRKTGWTRAEAVGNTLNSIQACRRPKLQTRSGLAKRDFFATVPCEVISTIIFQIDDYGGRIAQLLAGKRRRYWSVVCIG